jgi:hypothetical protein
MSLTHAAASRGDMREADMKCKVAACLLLSLLSDPLVRAACLLHSALIAGRLTRSRKVAAEDAFCCQFSAQTIHLRLTVRVKHHGWRSYFHHNCCHPKLAKAINVPENSMTP